MGAPGRRKTRRRTLEAALALLVLVAAAPRRVLADEPAQSAKPDPALEVYVEGDRTPTATRDPSAASYVLREDRLHAPGQSAANALSQAPGVQVSRAGASSDLSTASIRGASSAQTPIYLAGVRINDDITGTADLSLVPLWMIQRAEIFRGNAPADADRLGIGGAIFFEPILPRGTKVGAGLGLGSFGEVSSRLSGSFGDRRAGAMVALERRSARNDYTYVDELRPGLLEERTRRNADFTAYDLWSIGRYALRGGSITAIANGFVRDQGVSGLTLSPASAARSHVQRWLGAVTAAVPCSSGPGEAPGERCRIELQSAAILARRDIDDPLGELSLQSRRVASRGARVSQQARLRYRVGDRFALRASASQEFERLDIELDQGQRLGALRGVSRGAASATFEATKALELNALAALEYHRTESFGSAGVVAPMGRAGARLSLGHGVTLLANLGRYVRVPTLGELYGVSPVVLGNPELTPERSYSVDLGARLSTGSDHNRLFVELFGFARLASDLITYKQSQLGVVRPYNTRSARTLGLELSAGTQLFHHLHAELALTLLDPRDTSGEPGSKNPLLPYQARLVAAPYLEVYQGRIEAIDLDRAALGLRLNYRSKRLVDPQEQLPAVIPQTLLDLELTLLFARRRAALQLRLANLLDTRSSDVLGLPLPGRSGNGSLEVWW